MGSSFGSYFNSKETRYYPHPQYPQYQQPQYQPQYQHQQPHQHQHQHQHQQQQHQYINYHPLYRHPPPNPRIYLGGGPTMNNGEREITVHDVKNIDFRKRIFTYDISSFGPSAFNILIKYDLESAKGNKKVFFSSEVEPEIVRPCIIFVIIDDTPIDRNWLNGKLENQWLKNSGKKEVADGLCYYLKKKERIDFKKVVFLSKKYKNVAVIGYRFKNTKVEKRVKIKEEDDESLVEKNDDGIEVLSRIKIDRKQNLSINSKSNKKEKENNFLPHIIVKSENPEEKISDNFFLPPQEKRESSENYFLIENFCNNEKQTIYKTYNVEGNDIHVIMDNKQLRINSSFYGGSGISILKSEKMDKGYISNFWMEIEGNIILSFSMLGECEEINYYNLALQKFLGQNETLKNTFIIAHSVDDIDILLASSFNYVLRVVSECGFQSFLSQRLSSEKTINEHKKTALFGNFINFWKNGKYKEYLQWKESEKVIFSLKSIQEIDRKILNMKDFFFSNKYEKVFKKGFEFSDIIKNYFPSVFKRSNKSLVVTKNIIEELQKVQRRIIDDNIRKYDNYQLFISEYIRSNKLFFSYNGFEFGDIIQGCSNISLLETLSLKIYRSPEQWYDLIQICNIYIEKKRLSAEKIFGKILRNELGSNKGILINFLTYLDDFLKKKNDGRVFCYLLSKLLQVDIYIVNSVKQNPEKISYGDNFNKIYIHHQNSTYFAIKCVDDNELSNKFFSPIEIKENLKSKIDSFLMPVNYVDEYDENDDVIVAKEKGNCCGCLSVIKSGESCIKCYGCNSIIHKKCSVREKFHGGFYRPVGKVCFDMEESKRKLLTEFNLFKKIVTIFQRDSILPQKWICEPMDSNKMNIFLNYFLEIHDDVGSFLNNKSIFLNSVHFLNDKQYQDFSNYKKEFVTMGDCEILKIVLGISTKRKLEPFTTETETVKRKSKRRKKTKAIAVKKKAEKKLVVCEKCKNSFCSKLDGTPYSHKCIPKKSNE